PVLVPIDCKFPQEDYDRLLQAQSSGDPAAVAQATKALEKAIRTQAKSIEEKYVHPPRTTNFAVMYLPTEGLFAEVQRQARAAHDLGEQALGRQVHDDRGPVRRDHAQPGPGAGPAA